MGKRIKYTNGVVTVVWKPEACIHSRICFEKATGLPEVFDPKARPWINMQGAATDKIIEQVKKCPTDALGYFMNSEENSTVERNSTPEEPPVKETVVQILKNGPLLVSGNIVVKTADGSESHKTRITSFCRCGASKINPYCDGSHMDMNFED
jgi:uncharacterized Fe-S cluster protein YjdI